MNYTIVSTFNHRGYDTYGRRMIQTFLQNWPKEVNLWIYAEQCEVDISAPNLKVVDIEMACPDLVAFKKRWANVPYANGDVSSISRLAARSDSRKSFKWDAIRFSHKVYSIGHCAKTCNADIMLWMDADMVCHSPITVSDLERMCPAKKDICFLGRSRKFTECGLYSLTLGRPEVQRFIDDFVDMYNNAEQGIFSLDEWHDSFVFDAVRKRHKLRELDWTGAVFTGEGHPLINCEWGRWLDHLKGDRKLLGKSKVKDLTVQRTETYWRM